MNKLIVLLGVLLTSLVVLAAPVFAGPPGPPAPPDGHALVTICHQPGTPAQKTMDVPDSAVAGHMRHGDAAGPCAPPPPPCPVIDFIVDADGIASPGTGLPGAQDPGLVCGAALSTFPAPNPLGNGSGLDWFDLNGDGQWTQATDAMHEEGTAFCATAIRDAIYQAGFDCVVIDLSGSLVNGMFVTGDVEFGGGPPNLVYFDANANGTWDDGEDLVLDPNGDLIFN